MLPRDLGNGGRTSESTHPVVVGVDGSLTAVRAARWAAAVAEKLAASLMIVHAKPPLGKRLSGHVANVREPQMNAKPESAEDILAAAELAVRERFKDLFIATLRVDSHPDEALVEMSRRARLLVLGSDEVTLGAAILVGSTTTSVATRSICPVVAWRGDTAALTRQPIVLGVDHDHDSRVAVTAAFELAHQLGVGITAVHCWSTRRPADDVMLPVMIDWNKLERAERQHLSDSLAPLINLYPDVEVTQIVDPDKPIRALLRYADGAQLIVVGSRGRGLLAGALLGSTGLNLLHHSAVPVMICRSVEANE